MAAVWLGNLGAHADVSEMIFYPEADFSEGIAHFSYKGGEKRDYGFIFDKGVDAERILYARPAEHIVEKLPEGLLKLSFANTDGYTYLQKFNRSDFVISEDKGIVNILLSGGDCMSSPGCVTEENILSVAVPKGYRVRSYRGLDHDLKELQNHRWQIRGNVYTLLASRVKGASMVLQLEKNSAVAASEPKKAAVPAAASEGVARSLRLRNDALFERGSVVLSAQGKTQLSAFAQRLKRSKKSVSVGAHTDNVPLQRLKPLYGDNQNLSEVRAKAVGDYLRTQGIEPVSVKGFGETKPIAPNETEEGRLQNGRIELIVDPAADSAAAAGV